MDTAPVMTYSTILSIDVNQWVAEPNREVDTYIARLVLLLELEELEESLVEPDVGFPVEFGMEAFAAINSANR